MISIDRKENYYNFRNENPYAPLVKHRLGEFKVFCWGQIDTIKNLGVLHVPQWDNENGTDQSAEQMCNYQSTRKDPASVHIYADSDSFDLALPIDIGVYGCANKLTADYSIEAEISGYMNYNKEHWLSEIGTKKLINTAKAYIQLYQLQYGKDWNKFYIPAQIAVLNNMGVPRVPGFLQHRDVPILHNGVFHSAPVSFTYGQHRDISLDFPIEYFLELYKKELEKALNF